MLHRDFLVRQMQQAANALAQALARVLDLRARGEVDEAMRVVTEAYAAVPGLAKRMPRETSPEEILELCTADGILSVDLALRTADLLTEEGDLLFERGRIGEARPGYERALMLTRRTLSVEGAILPFDIARRIEDLEDRIDACEEPRGAG
jgi:hypothetical protein